MRGQQAVINLSTRIPTGYRMFMPGAWRENDRLRAGASRVLVDAAIAAGAPVYVQPTVTFVYPPDAPASNPAMVALSVFLCGAVTMTLEILAFRILQPTFGSEVVVRYRTATVGMGRCYYRVTGLIPMTCATSREQPTTVSTRPPEGSSNQRPRVKPSLSSTRSDAALR